MQTFLENHELFWYAVAGIGLVVELGIMGLSGPLLFICIASVITGILSHSGLLNSWAHEILSLGVLTALTAAMLWKPLKNFQNRKQGIDNSSDMIGLTVQVVDAVTSASGSIRYSGINWSARLSDNCELDVINGGESVTITEIKGNLLFINNT